MTTINATQVIDEYRLPELAEHPPPYQIMLDHPWIQVCVLGRSFTTTHVLWDDVLLLVQLLDSPLFTSTLFCGFLFYEWDT